MKRAIGAPAAVLLFVLSVATAAAQEGNGGRPVFMPGVRYFESPIADPIEPRFAIGLARTTLFSTRGPERPAWSKPDGAGEVQATAAIGATIPLLLLDENPDGGIVIGVVAGVTARFRVERPSRDDLGQDWTVGVPVEMAWGRSAARLRIVHRSSHIGDEFSSETGAARIEVGGEAIDGMFAQRIGGIRLYGGGGWIFHSNTDNTTVLLAERRLDRYTLQAGGDGTFHPFTNDAVSLLAGADWQTAERTNWRSTFGLAGGIGVNSGNRDARLIARYVGGGSTLGQFFLTQEEVWSLELSFGLQ